MTRAGFPFSAALVLAFLYSGPAPAAEPLAAEINARVEKHWQNAGVTPAAVADDAAFLRRLTLDLAGRVPTPREATEFAADRAADNRTAAVRRLMESPEYALQMGRILDEIVQGKYAGDPEFVEYLRGAVAEHRGWDQVFRDVMLGPWEAKERKGAQRFLSRRLNNLDDLTNETTVAFFGVNVSCAKCHDHPLVSDWKQSHYFGMASFFNPTYEGGKKNRKKEASPSLPEPRTVPVSYVTTKGERRTAPLMFLSGTVLEEPPPADYKPDPKAPEISRREQLVKVALEEKTFFSKAIVNRLWANLMGRGLVSPVDQMHSANKPAIPGLLDYLAEDLVEHNYDIDRLTAALVSSRVYELATVRPTEGEEVRPRDFNVAPLRPLTPAQYALSLVLVAGDGTFDKTETAEARSKKYRELEGQAGGLAGSRLLDNRSDRYQASAGEALFMSNNPEVQKLVMPTGNNLAARLAAVEDSKQLVDTAWLTILGRPATEAERDHLVKWLDERKETKSKACGQLVWALLTSAEFRFNH